MTRLVSKYLSWLKTPVALSNVHKVSRASDEHFKCLFLKQNPNWTATGVVVDIRGDKALFMMPGQRY
jgi:exoribonuclease-2